MEVSFPVRDYQVTENIPSSRRFKPKEDIQSNDKVKQLSANLSLRRSPERKFPPNQTMITNEKDFKGNSSGNQIFDSNYNTSCSVNKSQSGNKTNPNINQNKNNSYGITFRKFSEAKKNSNFEDEKQNPSSFNISPRNEIPESSICNYKNGNGLNNTYTKYVSKNIPTQDLSYQGEERQLSECLSLRKSPERKFPPNQTKIETKENQRKIFQSFSANDMGVLKNNQNTFYNVNNYSYNMSKGNLNLNETEPEINIKLSPSLTLRKSPERKVIPGGTRGGLGRGNKISNEYPIKEEDEYHMENITNTEGNNTNNLRSVRRPIDNQTQSSQRFNTTNPNNTCPNYNNVLNNSNVNRFNQSLNNQSIPNNKSVEDENHKYVSNNLSLRKYPNRKYPPEITKTEFGCPHEEEQKRNNPQNLNTDSNEEFCPHCPHCQSLRKSGEINRTPSGITFGKPPEKFPNSFNPEIIPKTIVFDGEEEPPEPLEHRDYCLCNIQCCGCPCGKRICMWHEKMLGDTLNQNKKLKARNKYFSELEKETKENNDRKNSKEKGKPWEYFVEIPHNKTTGDIMTMKSPYFIENTSGNETKGNSNSWKYFVELRSKKDPQLSSQNQFKRTPCFVTSKEGNPKETQRMSPYASLRQIPQRERLQNSTMSNRMINNSNYENFNCDSNCNQTNENNLNNFSNSLGRIQNIESEFIVSTKGNESNEIRRLSPEVALRKLPLRKNHKNNNNS
ncbi:MAG: hypothetical protein MJ252_22150 [archaeon]|nr:hypothetical protein [archaeon]